MWRSYDELVATLATAARDLGAVLDGVGEPPRGFGLQAG